jgi:NAD(P)-dependent dehydrogenase (short-subunit alcohol dehydrogenase family)
MPQPLTGKVALVTGANTGLGLETARGLLAQGATVVLACRDLVKGETARAELVASTGNPNAVLLALDLANVARIRKFVAAFEAKFQRLDVLVDNAGVWPRTRRKTVDGFELTFGVNHLGTFLLTTLLLPVLERSAPSRVVVLSSSLHAKAQVDFDDLQFKVRKHQGAIAYGQSKLCNLLFTFALARRLQGRGVTVNAVHPGVVATELSREAPQAAQQAAGKLTPAQGAVGPVHLATSAELEGVSGAYFEGTARKTPAPQSLDAAAQETLWAVSLALLKLPPEPKA